MSLMVAAGIAAGASALKGFGARKGAKKEARAYRRAFGLYQRLEKEADVTRKYIDPSHQFRAEAAQRLRNAVLGDPGSYMAQDPGYQFRLQEGSKEVSRAASARGMNLSGNVLAALEERAQGLASQEYGASVGRLMELGGGYAQNAAAAGQVYGQMKTTAIEGQVASALGKGMAKSRGIGATFGGIADAANAFGGTYFGGAGKGVGSLMGKGG